MSITGALIFRLRSLSAGNATMFLMMAGIYTLLFFPACC